MLANIPSFDYLLENSIHMTIFNKFKTDNPFINAIISTIAIGFFSFICNKLNNLYNDVKHLRFDCFFKKHMITLEGKICTCSSNYNDNIDMMSLYSDSFKAVNNHIISLINTNNSIYSVKEIYIPKKKSFYRDDEKKETKNIYIIDQISSVLIDEKKQIYVNTMITVDDENNDDKKKSSYKIENIRLEIYSYKSSLKCINSFIKEVTDYYLKNIEKDRLTKKFIYKLFKTPNEDISNYSCWLETEFKTTRNFNNLFFDKKEETLKKVDFFLKNKHWYEKMGMPYTLGIGLYGPPGTGKTSFIKALASYTNRHVIILSLKLLKKRQYLEEFFFELRYNNLNQQDIDFNEKIIVIEDIDCNDDVVLSRELKNKRQDQDKVISNKTTSQNSENLSDDYVKKMLNDDPITLDDILNLWDGIQETPGRILIISSNHYDKLDSALIRPGRIDVTLELQNANHKVINDLYNYLFKKKLTKKTLDKIPEYLYSPAQLINFYLQCENNSDKFLKLIEIK